jgi:hypothetical protein
MYPHPPGFRMGEKRRSGAEIRFFAAEIQERSRDLVVHMRLAYLDRIGCNKVICFLEHLLTESTQLDVRYS